MKYLQRPWLPWCNNTIILSTDQHQRLYAQEAVSPRWKGTAAYNTTQGHWIESAQTTQAKAVIWAAHKHRLAKAMSSEITCWIGMLYFSIEWGEISAAI